jgi:paraquat-inducible protein A
MVSTDLAACPDCDLLQHLPPLPPGASARCTRCRAVLDRHAPHGLERALAFTLAALVAGILANVFPLVGLEAEGERVHTTLLGAIGTLYDDGMPLVAALVFVTTVLMPFTELAAMAWLLTPLAFDRAPRSPAPVYRTLLRVRSWGMIEVFILGVLVALVKLHSLATVVPGISLWSFGALMLLLAAAASAFEPRAFWARLERRA